jgi:transcriptional regulator with XRE-family HTH domain
MKIGFLLKELRTLKGFTQQNIAELLNIERSTYAKWETDSINIDVFRLNEIAKLYGLDLEYMGRCIEANKIISKSDVTRLMEIADLKKRNAKH